VAMMLIVLTRNNVSVLNLSETYFGHDQQQFH
jgi:hypothetical protein